MTEGLSKRKESEFLRQEERTAALLEMENAKGKYTSEQIERWKSAGLSKPEWIPHMDWQIAGTLSPKQLMICKCAALLMKTAEIAELTGANTGYISSVVKSEAGQAEIDQIQNKFFSDTKKLLDPILPLAIKTAFQIMLDPDTKPQVRADAAFRFMDRVMGRPVQQVEINDNLIRQVYEKLDENKVIDIAAKRIENAVIVAEASKETEAPTEELDPVDSWLKENL